MRDETSRAPVPEPLPVDPAPGRKTPWILVAGIVLVALSVLGLLSYFIGAWAFSAGTAAAPPAIDDALETRLTLQAFQTPASVWFSGDERFAIAQYVDAADVPSVRVQPLAGGKARTLTGYRVVGVEPTGARIWLVPDGEAAGVDGSRETTPRVLDIAGDAMDEPPSELQVLDLLGDAEPRADVDARWKAWKGPGRFTVSVEIDVNKGASPSTLRFGDVESHLNVWSAKVPTDVVTFDPIGWSPSGEYLAVLSQARTAVVTSAAAFAVTQQGERVPLGDLGVPVETTGSILIFSAADGTLASRVPVVLQAGWPNGGAVALWRGSAASAPASDMLVFLGAEEVVEETGEEEPEDGLFAGLFTISPGGPAQLLAHGEEWSRYDTWIAGADGDVVYVCKGESGFDLDLFSVRGAELGEPASAPGGVTARWSSTRGLLTLRSSDMSEDRATWTGYLGNDPGTEPRQLFTLDGPPAY